jgi:hypothetical protein
METCGFIIGEGKESRPLNFTDSEGVTRVKRDTGDEAYAGCETNSDKPGHAATETLSGSQAANRDEDPGNEECGHSPAIASFNADQPALRE